MGCGLLLTSCTSKERQLDTALKSANKGFPQQVSEGITLEGFFLEGENIDIPITVDESKQTQEITKERIDQMRQDFVMFFTRVANQSKEFNEFMQLVSDNGKTLSLTIKLMPSKKEHKAMITKEDISKILAAPGKSAEEMARETLDIQIAAEAKGLPLELEGITIRKVHRDGTHIIYSIDVNEEKNFMMMKENVIVSKNNLLQSLGAAENAENIKLIVNAGCDIIYRYKNLNSGEEYDLNITIKDLRDIVKNATTTKLK